MRIEFLAPLALAALVMPAHADEPNPYYIGLSQGVTTDSNLFRAPEGGLVVRDTVSATGLRAGIDQPFGRQHFTFAAQADYNRYRHQTQLDHTDYDVYGQLDFEAVNSVSGTLRAEQQVNQFRDNASTAGVLTDKNLVRNSTASLLTRLGLVSTWSLEGGGAGGLTRYGNAAYQNRDLNQASVNAGVRWRPGGDFSLRLGARHAEGSYPNYAAGQADKFKRNDIDLEGELEASGASKLKLRVSRTREDHDVQALRDSSGWTGELGWLWQATGKTSFDVGLSSDNSAGSTGFDGALAGVQSSDASKSEQAHLLATWDATAKIRVTGRANYVRRTLDNGFAVAGGAPASVQERDRTRIVGIGLRYQPLRNLDLGCEATRERRNTDGTNLLTYPYTASTATCSAQIFLR